MNDKIEDWCVFKKIALIIIVLYASCSFAQPSHAAILKFLHFKPDKNVSKHLRLLLVINAKHAYLHPTKKKDVYKLVLQGLEKDMAYFADLPDRQSGHMHLKRFVHFWDCGFCFNEKFTPNASLVSRDKHKKPLLEDYVDLLSQPIFTNKHHRQLTIMVKSINKHNIIKKTDLGECSLLVYEECY